MKIKAIADSFSIRRAMGEDAVSLVDLKQSVISESPFLLELPSEFTNDTEAVKYQILRLSKDGYFLLAEADAKVIGMLTFGRSDFSKIHHRGGLMMLVDKNYRRMGVGEALLGTFLQEAKKDPTLEQVNLSVMSENTSAIRLYQRLGFVIQGCRARAYKFPDNSYQDEIFMGLQI